VFSTVNRLQKTYWFIARPSRNGVKVAIFFQTDLLLVQHVYHRHWNLPGGGFKPAKETPEEAARREIREELDLELIDLRAVGEYESQREYKRDRVHCFVASSPSRAFRASPELSAISWFSLGEIPVNASLAVFKTLAMIEQASAIESGRL
jgi:8-oxo-dGTP pyrophosphatase MutT (NUDIX family)